MKIKDLTYGITYNSFTDFVDARCNQSGVCELHCPLYEYVYVQSDMGCYQWTEQNQDLTLALLNGEMIPENKWEEEQMKIVSAPMENIKDLCVSPIPKIQVVYHNEDLDTLAMIKQGDLVDLRSAEDVVMKQGEYKLISLGISMRLPKGCMARVYPRSSTFKNFGIIMANGVGIIDESYCGTNDIWRFPAIALRDTEIHVNDRIAQFEIVKKPDKVRFVAVDELDDTDRGGIGSTGKN